MSVTQYNRKLSVIVGNGGDALDFSEFRVVFSIRRGDTQTPNSADIRIYNVAENTANRVLNEFTRVVIQAGYEGNYGLIFDGTVKQARKGRESQTDTYIDITAADGDELYNFSIVALSLAAGAKPNDSVQAFIQTMANQGVGQGYAPVLSDNACVRGRVYYGMTKDELREFAENNGCAWSIQDGKLTMIPLTAYIPGDVPVLSSATGLIGMPEQTQNGIQMRLLLNPSIKIGRVVKLDNATVNKLRYGLDRPSQAFNQPLANQVKTNADGLYYVMWAEHSGDTRGNNWYTDLTCLAVDATITQDIASKAAIFPEAGSIKVK